MSIDVLFYFDIFELTALLFSIPFLEPDYVSSQSAYSTGF